MKIRRKNKPDTVNQFEHLLSQHKAHKKANTRNVWRKDSGEYGNPENHPQSEDERNDESFDEFILRNFSPFTGRQNVTQ